MGKISAKNVILILFQFHFDYLRRLAKVGSCFLAVNSKCLTDGWVPFLYVILLPALPLGPYPVFSTAHPGMTCPVDVADFVNSILSALESFPSVSPAISKIALRLSITSSDHSSHHDAGKHLTTRLSTLMPDHLLSLPTRPIIHSFVLESVKY